MSITSPFWHSRSQVLPEAKIWKPSEGVETENVIQAKPDWWAMQSRVQAGSWQMVTPRSFHKLHRMLSRAFWPIVGQVWRHREWERGKARKMGYTWPYSWLHLWLWKPSLDHPGTSDPAVFDELCTTTFLPPRGLGGSAERELECCEVTSITGLLILKFTLSSQLIFGQNYVCSKLWRGCFRPFRQRSKWTILRQWCKGQLSVSCDICLFRRLPLN